MSTVLLTGGTGLIGRALIKVLQQRGYHLKILTRQANLSIGDGVEYLAWDPLQDKLPLAALDDVDYLIHLAGANVAEKRWTAARKRELLESRIYTVDLLWKAFADRGHRLKAVVSASAIGYYDARQDRWFQETDPPGEDFLAQTCVAWEAHVQRFQELASRVVMLRTGIVLSQEGGFIEPFLQALRWGVAPILGSGTQWISWIHIHDLCRLYANSLITEHMLGPYNAVAPQPVQQKELILTLARMIKKQFFVPIYVPSWSLKLMLGEMSVEVLKSLRVSAEKVQAIPFQFSFPEIGEALNDLFKH
ncbi:MAG: TIGR01777 family oxidoreductase [Thermoflavifilum sp.]|nr:TIGR01777 family oxidoreductase [Thermoflavifilum sp.]